MKKFYVLLILLTVLALVSCKTRERIVYLQDVVQQEAIATQPVMTLKLASGDKIGVMVTSTATPQLAMRYNLSVPNNTNSSQDADKMRYTIDENGNVDLLGVGRVQVGGLTRSEAAAKIQSVFRNGVINDAVVTVSAYNQYVTVLGDVSRPGRYEVSRDNITLLELLGMAGDLNITARRDAIKVIRQEGNVSKTYFVDLRSKDIFNSPVYNLQQNDIVYVEPNRVKMGQSTNNDNSIRNISTWLSVTSVLTSICILIFR